MKRGLEAILSGSFSTSTVNELHTDVAKALQNASIDKEGQELATRTTNAFWEMLTRDQTGVPSLVTSYEEVLERINTQLNPLVLKQHQIHDGEPADRESAKRIEAAIDCVVKTTKQFIQERQRGRFA